MMKIKSIGRDWQNGGRLALNHEISAMLAIGFPSCIRAGNSGLRLLLAGVLLRSANAKRANHVNHSLLDPPKINLNVGSK